MRSVVQYYYLRKPQDFSMKKVGQTYPTKSYGYKAFLRNSYFKKTSHILGQDEISVCSDINIRLTTISYHCLE